jgi:hypothetical protein
MNQESTPPQNANYEITIDGRLDAHWSEWFDGMTLHHEADSTTVLRGPIIDQAALYGILEKLRDLGLPLLSLARIDH